MINFDELKKLPFPISSWLISFFIALSPPGISFVIVGLLWVHLNQTSVRPSNFSTTALLENIQGLKNDLMKSTRWTWISSALIAPASWLFINGLELFSVSRSNLLSGNWIQAILLFLLAAFTTAIYFFVLPWVIKKGSTYQSYKDWDLHQENQKRNTRQFFKPATNATILVAIGALLNHQFALFLVPLATTWLFLKEKGPEGPSLNS